MGHKKRECECCGFTTICPGVSGCSGMVDVIEWEECYVRVHIRVSHLSGLVQCLMYSPFIFEIEWWWWLLLLYDSMILYTKFESVYLFQFCGEMLFHKYHVLYLFSLP